MRTLFKFFLLVSGLLFMSSTIQAQNYKSAIGGRLGSPISVSYKTFVSDQNALEAYVGFRNYSTSWNWISVNAAYQKHNDLDEIVDGLQWYVGGGAGVYFWAYSGFGATDFSTTSIGLQGYAGLDYAFEDVPINISVDWVPTLFIGNSFFTGFGAGYGSLSVRYILGRD